MPIEAPPSYRGTTIKYSYKITIATQKVNSHIKMVRIPFRVLPISPIINMQDVAALCGNETTEDLQPTNPFSEERKVETPLTMALQVLQVIKIILFDSNLVSFLLYSIFYYITCQQPYSLCWGGVQYLFME